MVVLVGWPASGKSTLAERDFATRGYVRVNQDTLGTPAKCLAACKEALSKGRSCVVDNTNPTAKKREEFLKVAQQHKVPARVLWMASERDLAEHLNKLRGFKGGARIPTIAYNVFNKNFEDPREEEGFVSVTRMPFNPHFDTPEDRERFQWRL